MKSVQFADAVVGERVVAEPEVREELHHVRTVGVVLPGVPAGLEQAKICGAACLAVSSVQTELSPMPKEVAAMRKKRLGHVELRTEQK